MPISKAEADPRVLIREGDMSSFQVIVVTLCVLICALDGFDVLVVAFTAAAIAKDFNLNPTDLGILFSAGLAGMGFGALFIGPMGDKIGRRSTVLLCLVHPVQRHADFIDHPRRDGTGADAVLHRPRHRRRAGEHQHRRRGIRLQPAAQPVDLADVAGLSDRRHAGRRVLGLPDLRVRLAVGLCVRRTGGPDPGACRHPLHAGIAGLPDRPPPGGSAGQGQPRAGPHRPVRPCPPSPHRNGRRKRPTPACSPSSGLPMPGGRWRFASRISA